MSKQTSNTKQINISEKKGRKTDTAMKDKKMLPFTF